jgi:hypothetical protein
MPSIRQGVPGKTAGQLMGKSMSAQILGKMPL